MTRGGSANIQHSCDIKYIFFRFNKYNFNHNLRLQSQFSERKYKKVNLDFIFSMDEKIYFTYEIIYFGSEYLYYLFYINTNKLGKYEEGHSETDRY